MNISDFTVPELRFYLGQCNFTKDERTLFLCRAQGDTLEEIAETLNVDISTAKRISRKVNKKLNKIDSFMRL